LSEVITALRSVGQDQVAKALAAEILRAHLLNRFATGTVDGTPS
jgi:hypothetical protein